jgi:cobalamin biosynthesis protein CobD/CbiB
MREMMDLAPSHVAPRQPRPGWRIAVAALLLGVTLAGAAVLYSQRRQHVDLTGSRACGNPHMSRADVERCLSVLETKGVTWAGPTALAVLVVGLAGTGAVLATRRRSGT